MRKILDQVQRVDDMLLERAMQVADGSLPLSDRHHIAVTFTAGFLDAVVELDRLAYEHGHAIRQKAVLHADQRVTPVPVVTPPSPSMEHPTQDAKARVVPTVGASDRSR
jgi:hypothetical protein